MGFFDWFTKEEEKSECKYCYMSSIVANENDDLYFEIISNEFMISLSVDEYHEPGGMVRLIEAIKALPWKNRENMMELVLKVGSLIKVELTDFKFSIQKEGQFTYRLKILDSHNDKPHFIVIKIMHEWKKYEWIKELIEKGEK